MSVSDCSLAPGYLPAFQSPLPLESTARSAIGFASARRSFATAPQAFWRFVEIATPVGAAILALELSNLAGVAPPAPGAILVAAIVFTTLSAGRRAGLIATILAVIYELLALSAARPAAATWPNAAALALLAAASLVSVMIAGMLKNRAESLAYSLARRSAEESLQAERSQAQRILHQLPLGVVVCDAASGDIVFANEKAVAIFGPDVNRIRSVGYPCIFHLAGGRSYSPHEWPWTRCAQLRAAIDEEFLYSRADGRLAIVRARVSPVAGADGRPVAAVMSVSDVTHRFDDADGIAHEALLPATLEPAPCSHAPIFVE